MKFYVWMYIIWSLGQYNCFAQYHYGGLFPEMGITKKLCSNMQARLKVESQHGIINMETSEKDRLNYFHDRTDLQGFLIFKMNKSAKLSVGYQYRLQEGFNNHRTIQQIADASNGKKFRLGHRIRTDQTFEDIEPIQWRVRYRLAIRYPVSESYHLLLSTEPIFARQGTLNAIESRWVLALGVFFSDGSRFQIGPDFRWISEPGSVHKTRTWLKLGWFKQF